MTQPSAPLDGGIPEAVQQRLEEIGVESPTERAVKSAAPWVMSGLLHLGLIALGFLITWTVVLLKSEPAPPVIVADFDRLTFEPLSPLSVADEPIEPTALDESTQPMELEQPIDDLLHELEFDPISLESAAGPTPPSTFAPEAAQDSVSFVGLSSSNARRIIYVIDASGSMIASLQIVIDELARSLDELSSQQEFAIIFFQSNDAVTVPPASRMTPARSNEKLRALAWIRRNIVPRGRSNPLRALETALAFEPDVVFLLSENITGSGQFEIDQRDLLALLDTLNPLDRRSGRRRTQINCIQFLDPDPLDTLRRIAEAHGGERGYKFLDRQELGIAAP